MTDIMDTTIGGLIWFLVTIVAILIFFIVGTLIVLCCYTKNDNVQDIKVTLVTGDTQNENMFNERLNDKLKNIP